MSHLNTLDQLDFTPEPVVVKPTHRKALIAVVIASVLVLLGCAGYAVHEHQSLGTSRAHAASLSHQLKGTQADLKDSKSAVSSLRTENGTLKATAEKCSVYVPIGNHMVNALRYELKAVQGGTFGAIIWLPKASTEMHAVSRLLDSHQSYDGELNDVCGPSSTTNS
jgi:hypothetical protein